eukprot:349602-Chlamydomonas_euryale.AAC.3
MAARSFPHTSCTTVRNGINLVTPLEQLKDCALRILPMCVVFGDRSGVAATAGAHARRSQLLACHQGKKPG